MKKIFISIQIIFTFFLLYADNKFKNFFYFDSYSYTEYIIDEHGWLEHDKLQNTGFSDCKVITIEKLKEIASVQIDNKQFDEKVKKYLASGDNYPTSISKSLKDFQLQKLAPE